MRDIKFRHYDKRLNNFLIFELLPVGIARDETIVSFDKDRLDSPIEQYTGLKDKNGVEIYEGDILKVRSLHYEKDIGLDVVCFKKGCFCLRYEYWSDGLHKWRSIENYDSSDLDVVGNVHQNPDLLRKEQ